MKYANPVSPDLLTPAELIRTVVNLTEAEATAADTSKPMGVRSVSRSTAADLKSRLALDAAAREKLPGASSLRTAEHDTCGCRPRPATVAECRALVAESRTLRQGVAAAEAKVAVLQEQLTAVGLYPRRRPVQMFLTPAGQLMRH